jgi:hypothetical protein
MNNLPIRCTNEDGSVVIQFGHQLGDMARIAMEASQQDGPTEALQIIQFRDGSITLVTTEDAEASLQLALMAVQQITEAGGRILEQARAIRDAGRVER